MKHLILLLLVPAFMAGCGGGGTQEVTPSFFVIWPDRNRGLEVNEAINSGTATLIDLNGQRLHSPIVFERGDLSLGAATQVRIPKTVKPGEYNLFLTTGTDYIGQDLVAETTDLVRVSENGTIVRPDGSPFVRYHPLMFGFRLIDVEIPPGQTKPVGERFSFDLLGRLESDPTRPFGVDFRAFGFEWIEGRELLDIVDGETDRYSYIALRPGKIRFRVRQDGIVSNIGEIILTPRP